MATDYKTLAGQEFDRSAFESLMKRKNFYWQSFEPHGPVKGLFDYGHPLATLEAQFLSIWRDHFVRKERMQELKCAMITPYNVFKASGHVDKFADFMCKDPKTGEILRADHLIKDVLEARLKSDKEARGEKVEEAVDDPTKKKKKKVKAPKEDDFTKQLEKLELKEGDEVEEVPQEQEGDMHEGTGIWAHDETKTIGYSMLLGRFFNQLTERNPDHVSPGTKSYKIPPPQCMREGNRKTVFANIADICKRMKRTEEHVTAYLFAELGTSGSVDGSRRLVIKGRFQQKQIENVVRKYIIEYVTCKTCKSPDTELNKGENRLYFITCNNCGSRRSVTAIKTGFSAQVGKRRKMQG